MDKKTHINHGKIKYHEALAYSAERNNDYAEAHRQLQQAEFYKREKHAPNVLHKRTRRETDGDVGEGKQGARHSGRNRKDNIVSQNQSAEVEITAKDKNKKKRLQPRYKAN